MEDPGYWTEALNRMARLSGASVLVAADLQAFVAQLVPDLYQARNDGDWGPLQGRVADQVLVQQERLAPAYRGLAVLSVDMAAVGPVPEPEGPRLRTLLTITAADPSGRRQVERQTWDFVVGSSGHVVAARCSVCGAPLRTGDLQCRYCGTSVASQTAVATVPLQLTRIAENL